MRRTEFDHDEFRAAYLRGDKTKDMGKRFGMTQGSVSRWARNLDLPLRQPQKVHEFGSPVELKGGEWVWRNGVARWYPHSKVS